jgi:hypothetical protein
MQNDRRGDILKMSKTYNHGLLHGATAFYANSNRDWPR